MILLAESVWMRPSLPSLLPRTVTIVGRSSRSRPNFSSTAPRSTGPVKAATSREKAGPHARLSTGKLPWPRTCGKSAATVPNSSRRKKSSTTIKSNGSRHSGAARRRSRSSMVRTASLARHAGQKFFEGRNAGIVAIEAMLCSGNRLSDLDPPVAVPGETCCQSHIVVERGGDGIGHSDKLEHRHRVAAPHQGARQCHNRKIVCQALQARRAARPPDAVENDVAEAGGGVEALLVEDRADDAMIGGLPAACGESAVEASAEQIGHVIAGRI